MNDNNLNPSEKSIIEKVYSGNREAYGELFNRHVDEIYRYIFFRISNIEDSEELVQDVFSKALEAIMKSIPKKYNFRALVYRIAHNMTVDYWRKQKKQVDSNPDKIDTLKDPQPTPEQQMISQETIREITNGIKELEPRLQQVIICRFVNGLSASDTAKIMGIKENHVRVLQHRALKKIRIGVI